MTQNVQGGVILDQPELKGKAGDTITYEMNPRMTAGWLPQGAMMDGNEHKHLTYTDTITIKEFKMAATVNSIMDMQRSDTITPATYDALVSCAAENMDKEYFDALDATNTHVIYEASSTMTGTSTIATATSAVTAGDKLNPEFLTKLKSGLITGFNRSRVPVQPFIINGRSYWILLTHPDALADLENDTTFLAARKDAMARSDQNPLFVGAEAVWNQFIIHTHENVTIGSTAGVYWVKSHVLGMHSIARTFPMELKIVPKKVAYEGEEVAWGIMGLGAVKKSQFNSQDYGAVNVVTARSNVSEITF
jgi:N4-gp56 family major capsid protein